MKSRRHILWINHFAVPSTDGGGTRHFEIGRELVRRGWQVTIAASDFHLQTRRYTRRPGRNVFDTLVERYEGVEFHWLWAAPYRTNDWRRAWNWLSFAWSLLRQSRGKDERPDVIIGSSPHLFAAFAASELARRYRVPFIFEVRDLWPESLVAAGGRKGPVYYVFDWIAGYLYRRADRIICLARGAEAYLVAKGIDSGKLVYVPNGVDTASFAGVARSPRDTFTLVYAGAHGPANGLDVVLDTAHELRDDPGIRFLLVGGGPVKQDLLESARNRHLHNVEFRDTVSKQRLPEVFSEADAGLMVLRDTPLFAYGVSPNKLFDYFGAGLPVVCNVPGEVAAMVEAAGAGEQAEPGSTASLAAAIVRLAARTHGQREMMGRSARDWVSQEHGREILAERLESALHEMLLD